MRVIIEIKKEMTEAELDAFHVTVDDYDDGLLTLIVDSTEIDANYTVNGGIYPVEFWGLKTWQEELEITVQSVFWEGYPVINEEEVCWKLWEADNA